MMGCPGCGAPDDQGCFKGCPEIKKGISTTIRGHIRELYDETYKTEPAHLSAIAIRCWLHNLELLLSLEESPF